MRRRLPLLLLALSLAGCGDCDCCKKKEPAPTASAAAAGAPQAPTAATSPASGGGAAAVEAEPEAARTPPEVKVAWRGEGARLELSVWEMHCQGCAMRVEEALKALPGVSAVEASWSDSKVSVTLADASGRAAAIEKIRAALKAEEFRVLGE